MTEPIKVIIAGAGSRGTGHAAYAKKHPDQMRVVGVAEPREYYRNHLAEEHSIPVENVFSSWDDMAARDKFADAVVIATQDTMHVGPAIAFADKGYHMALEKPLAPDAEGCKQITEAVIRNRIIFSVFHVLRYTPYTQTLKASLDSGAIGDICSLQHLEPVGYWHQAHSYVRGNWRNEKESSFMLLAKSCHDLDWIHYIMGRKCTAVSSFGSLKHFKPECQPEGAADRCLDCAVEATCPYSAKKIYLGRVAKGETDWPTNILVPDPTEETVTEALRTGPYGRCVYKCDNDVVDNQVVNMFFEGGATAAFTMTAFTRGSHRITNLFGTRGQIHGKGSLIEKYDFLTDETEEVPIEISDSSILGGHGGGDYNCMKAFVSAVTENDPSLVLTGPEETLQSHLMVFAAEKARVENCVVTL